MQVTCPQCGAAITAVTETSFYRCPFCTSSFVVQDGTGIRQYTFTCDLDDRIAWTSLSEALAEMEVRKNIEKVSCEHRLLPFWLFSLPDGTNRLVYAGAADLPGVAGVTLPGSDLEFTTPEMELPHFALTAAGAIARAGIKEPLQTSLLYLPMYSLTYRYAGTDYEALVSAADRRCCLAAAPPADRTEIPARHIAMICIFAAILIIEAATIHDLVWRGAAFAGSFAISYPMFYAMLRREIL